MRGFELRGRGLFGRLRGTVLRGRSCILWCSLKRPSPDVVRGAWRLQNHLGVAAVGSTRPRVTLEALLGREFSSRALAATSADQLEIRTRELAEVYDRWSELSGSSTGSLTRETLERALPVLRALVSARRAEEKADDLLAGEAHEPGRAP